MKSTRSMSAQTNEKAQPAAASLLNRREFLHSAASAGLLAGLSRSGFAQGVGAKERQTARQAAVDNRLPDGTEFRSWEEPLRFGKTYYVDNQSPAANDAGPGTREKPFRTIGKAAEVLEPGERVVIASGTYRECVRPMRGGTGPRAMISYEAAPGAKVFVKGSEILNGGWRQDPAIPMRQGGTTQKGIAPAVWRHELPAALFPDGYNPFALDSAPGDREWLDTRKVDMGPYFRKRGLVFVDGRPMEPMEKLREVGNVPLPKPRPASEPLPKNGLPERLRGGPIMQEIGGSADARFWVEQTGTALHVRLPAGEPNEHVVEVTTREQVFAPLVKGLGYIRVKGLTMQHAGNGYPIPQRGLLSTSGGHHWIVEDNTIEWANGNGTDIANGDWNEAPTPGAGEGQIIRRNTIRYCGVEGIGGMGTLDAAVEDNLIEWCGWADAERAWEAAGAKFHRARNMMIRRNVVRHIRHANAVWLDSGNANCRITGNVFADILTVSAAVHIEVNLDQNQIDNNVIWDVRNAEPGTPGQRGCAGSGVFINASNKVAIAQNLIGRCDNAGVYAIIREDRAGTGTASGNSFYNNIVTSCGKSAIVFLNADNRADGNLYASMPADFLAFGLPAARTSMDLAEWRKDHGWDEHGSVGEMQISFDPDRLVLTMHSEKLLPKEPVFAHLEVDMLGKDIGQTRAPGPIADPAAASTWTLDPRKLNLG